MKLGETQRRMAMNRLRTWLQQYQVVWWWPIIEVNFGSWAWGVGRFGAADCLFVIYEWWLGIGPLEIRKFVSKERAAGVLAEHNAALREALGEERDG